MEKRTPLGKFIHTTWGNLHVRCCNGKHCQTIRTKKNKTYASVYLLISRDEFISFCIENEALILSLKRPSLDRIDDRGNYTLDNIQIMELGDNIRKSKMLCNTTEYPCRKCGVVKPAFAFSVDKRRSLGRTNLCKVCDNKRRSLKSTGK